MTHVTASGFERRLAALRAEGEAVPVAALCRRLLALRAEPRPELARCLAGALLGVPPAGLADPLDAARLRPAPEARVARRSLRRARFAVVDLETTGVSPRRSQILEIGAVAVGAGASPQRFATLVRPEGRVPRFVTALTGIDDAAVRDAPARPEALAAFRRWLGRSGALAFVAHNARFDAGFLARDLRDLGLPPLGVPVLCTQKLSRRLLPGLGRYDLDHLCAHFGIANGARHRATGDAEATARAWLELLPLAAEAGLATLGDALDLQARPLRRRRRRR